MRLRPSLTTNTQTDVSPRLASSLFHRRIFQVSLLVHVFSLLACAAASGLSSARPCSFQNELQKHASKHNASKTKIEQCVLWNDHLPQKICEIAPRDRAQKLKSIFLFSQVQPLSLYEVLAAGSRDGNARTGLLPGADGQFCLTTTGPDCVRCYERLSQGLRKLDEAYRSFDQTLLRFDCLPAVDTASATRPFSPNGSCNTCRSWYRRWLLVQTVRLWKTPPCVNWCYYAQLACPHLATSKVVDYAGHPSFQCRDLEIASREQKASKCECVHPCDLRGVVPVSSTSKRSRSVDGAHDFYASEAHCHARARECGRVKTNDRITAHDRRQQQRTSSGWSSSSVGSLAVSVVFLSML